MAAGVVPAEQQDVGKDARDLLDVVLRDRLVTPLFQPIVDLASGAVVGVEALARGPAGTPLERPDQLFGAATQAGKLGALDLLCAERALECAFASPVTPPLVFVNAEPAVLDQPLSPRLLDLILSRPPFQIMLEYTERALPTAPAALLRVAGVSHQLGNGIALDDVGADPMSLAFLPFIEPDVIKLDMHLLRHPSAPATTEVCAAVAAAARRTDAMVIAEGIETEADLVTARSLGAHWGQGWHLGRPAALSSLQQGASATGRSAIRSPQPGLHQPAGSPLEVALAGGARPIADEAVGPALDRMGDAVQAFGHAVVLGSYADPAEVAAWRPHSAGVIERAAYSAVLRPNSAGEPFAGESCLLVMTPDYAAALGRGGNGEVVRTEDRAVVASIGRVLLQRLARQP